jgi:hypothetical protein
MAEAQFTPYLPPGGIVDAAFSGANQMQSLMDRGQQMRQRQEMADRQKEIFDVGRPVMEAKAQADLAVAQGTLYNARQIQQLRSQFGEASKAAGAEYQAAMQQPTYEKQANALSDVAQKYSYFELFPEGKAFMDTIQNKGLQQTHYGILDTQNRAALARENQRFEDENALAITKGEQTRETNAAYGKGQTVQQRNIQRAMELKDAGHPEEAQILLDSTKPKGAGGSGSSSVAIANKIMELAKNPDPDSEVQAAVEQGLLAALQKQGHINVPDFQQYVEKVKEAYKAGDMKAVDTYEARLLKMTHNADTQDRLPLRPQPPAPPSMLQRAFTDVKNKVSGVFGSEPIPVPAHFPAPTPDTKTITVDGKTWPVYFDANGNRAYKTDKGLVEIHDSKPAP